MWEPGQEAAWQGLGQVPQLPVAPSARDQSMASPGNRVFTAVTTCGISPRPLPDSTLCVWGLGRGWTPAPAELSLTDLERASAGWHSPQSSWC